MQLNLGARENECLNTARERERAWQSMKNVSKQITSFECWSTETIELYTVAPVCRLFGLSDMRMQWSTKSSVDNAFKCYHYEYFKDGNTQVVRANNGTRSNLIISRGYSWSDDGVIHELYKTVLGKSVRRQKKKHENRQQHSQADEMRHKLRGFSNWNERNVCFAWGIARRPAIMPYASFPDQQHSHTVVVAVDIL